MSTNGMLVDLRDASGQPRLPFTLLSFNVRVDDIESAITLSTYGRRGTRPRRRPLPPHDRLTRSTTLE